MKVNLLTKDFLSALQMVCMVIPTKSTLPILQCVKLKTLDNRLELSGTDLDYGMKCYIENFRTEDTETLLLPAHTLLSIVRETTDDNLTLEIDGPIASIQAKNSYYKMAIGKSDDYPEFPDINKEKTKTVAIALSDLQEMVLKTSFATATTASSYAFAGILTELGHDYMKMVATDGRRLALIKRKSEGEQSKKEGNLSAIIPAKVLTILQNVTAAEELINIILSDTHVKFSGQKFDIFSRLIDGQFPDYTQVVPKTQGKRVTLESSEFLSALRRSSLILTDKLRAVKFSFSPNNLTILARSQELGESKIDVTVKYGEDNFEITFNPDFFLDVLRHLNKEDVNLEFFGKDKACLLRISADKDYLYLIMPLSIDIGK